MLGSRELSSAVSAENGIQATKELGRYRGMPILQKRINKETFGTVLECMSSKHAGWKGSMLSLAGHITLTKAVLGSIPVHTMSSIRLPESTTRALDHVSRDFIWGSTLKARKQHLIGWDKVCLSKAEGGLGIRKTSIMNKALIAKLGWRLLHDNTSLWARVLRSKCKVGDIHDTTWSVARGTWSSTWRSVVVGIRDVIRPGHGWVIGDGQRVDFWTDKWLGNSPLIDEVVAEVSEGVKRMKATKLWLNGTGWDMGRIAPFVSDDTKLELAAVVVDKAMAGIWQRIVPRGKKQAFFAMSCLEWMYVNFSENAMTENGP
ncbi:unnamed protein product [Microthlaspi erraticum]|uniref:Reverse transcriptase zinc-binding domain-containing protein n=1 Tax=Microthlaspi erraticum TaxID=1685480 RepID=A0A6D2JIP0_9BRAS|nr:unnamed protein product [Microthlaspi erraticum]